MLEPILALFCLGIVPFFSSFLSNLLDTTALPAKHILPHHFLLQNQPNFDQQLTSQADHEHFYFLSVDPHHYVDMQFDHG